MMVFSVKNGYSNLLQSEKYIFFLHLWCFRSIKDWMEVNPLKKMKLLPTLFCTSSETPPS
jgi:hypothetical protein